MSFIVVIPARLASTRLPNKPLLDIGGKPMIQRVWERAQLSEATRVIIATDDARVAVAVESFGGEVCMTRATHESGTDRLQEVAALLAFDDAQIIVNVQGDEPLIPPAVINQVARNLAASDRAGIATLAKRIRRRDEIFNPNIVKVVVDNMMHALYFSRAPIPWDRELFDRDIQTQSNSDDAGVDGEWARHIGIYAYRAEFLHAFVQWPVGRLERLEKLEQLRALENGVAIHVDESLEEIPPGVDTAEDLEHVREWLRTAQ
ncbi:MAG: 3-deoxy-D-manno-octulosonate cytidylyltransferase [Verrucomicrobiaceae bacterium]|nr:3-deoxy-D-manno-octulosonate cytidylyltransferase [Verrucomicrobiaceae bacterium]